jgi:hypothetical protein
MNRGVRQNLVHLSVQQNGPRGPRNCTGVGLDHKAPYQGPCWLASTAQAVATGAAVAGAGAACGSKGVATANGGASTGSACTCHGRKLTFGPVSHGAD